MVRLTGSMNAAGLRRSFVVPGLFKTGRVVLNYWETERTVVGGATPSGKSLALPVPRELRARNHMKIISLAPEVL